MGTRAAGVHLELRTVIQPAPERRGCRKVLALKSTLYLSVDTFEGLWDYSIRVGDNTIRTCWRIFAWRRACPEGLPASKPCGVEFRGEPVIAEV